MNRYLFKLFILISFPLYLYAVKLDFSGLNAAKDMNFSSLDGIKKLSALKGVSDLNKELNKTLSDINISFKNPSSDSNQLNVNESLQKDKHIPLKQSQCILFEKNNLIVDFTNLNKAGHYLISVSLASNKDFMAGFFCVSEPNERSETYHCMGECDAGRLWVKLDEKGHKVKFGNIRLDTEYIKEGTDDIDSQYIESKDTNYMQGTYVPCL